MIGKRMVPRAIIMALMMVMAVSGLTWAAEKSTAGSYEIPAPSIPQPQVFCGYCHVTTYPEIIKKGYESWRESKHKEVGCVQCHYPPPPTDKEGQVVARETLPSGTHIPKKAPTHFSFVQIGGGIVKTRSTIVNESCTTAACHGGAGEKFMTKEIKLSDSVSFRHEPHVNNEELIPGLQLNCINCHQRETEEKHFEVSQATCNLCHFTNVKFNEGRAKCENCHQLPGKQIKTADGVFVNHQKLKEAKVDCSGCHIDLVQASAGSRYELFVEDGALKSILVLGAGQIKKENCLNCHDQPDIVELADDSETIHAIHVFEQNARCFDCHGPVIHQKAEEIETIPRDCSACHTDSHKYQRLLTAGKERPGIMSSPDPMYKARTNCLGCHNEAGLTEKGHSVLTASDKSCVKCHTEGHDKVLASWKNEVKDEIENTLRAEKKALAAMDGKQGALSPENLKKMKDLLARGRRELDIVRLGNGVHNVKYSILLLDSALTAFDEVTKTLKAGQ